MVLFEIAIDGRPAVLEIQGVQGAGDKLIGTLDRLSTTVEKLEKKLEEQAKATREATVAEQQDTAASERAEQQAKELAAAKEKQKQATIANRLATDQQRRATALAAAENEQYQRSLAGVRTALGGTRAGLLSLVAVGGLGLGLGASLKLLGDYQEKTAILGVVSRATAEEQAILGSQARLLGEATRYSASQAVEAQIALARAGLSAQEVLGATADVLNLATIGELSLGEAATIAANGLRQFNIDAENTERVVDSLVIVSNRSNTDVRQMAEALAYVGPIANAVGLSIEKTSAAIGVLGDAGINASSAGTNMRGMLSDLLSQNDVTARALTRLGLTYEQVNPLTHDLSEIMETLRERSFGATEAVEIFGDRNSAAALILANNTEKLRALEQAQRDFTKEAEKGAKVVEENLKGAYLGLASAVEGALLAKEAGLLGTVLRGVVDTGTDAIRVMFGLSQEEKQVGLAGQTAAVGIEVLTGALLGLAATKIVTGLSSIVTLVKAIGSVGGIIGPFGALPLTPALIGLGAAAAGAYAIFDVFSDSMARSRAEMEKLRKEAEGFRESFESVESATKRVSEAYDKLQSDGGASSQNFINVAARRENLTETLRALDDQIVKRGKEGFDPVSMGVARAGILGIANDVLPPGKVDEVMAQRRRMESPSGLLGYDSGPREFGIAVGVGAEADRQTELKGLRDVIAETIKKNDALAESARQTAASVREDEQKRIVDHAAATAAETSRKAIDELNKSLARRIELTKSGDREGLRLLDLEEQYKDEVEKGGEAVKEQLRIAAQQQEMLAGLANRERDARREIKTDLRESNRELQEYEQRQERITQRLLELRDERTLFGLSPEDREMQSELQRLEREGAGPDQLSQARKMIEDLQALKRIETISYGIGDALVGGLERATFQAQSLQDVVRSITIDIYQGLYRQLVSAPLAAGIGSGLSGLLGGIFGPSALPQIGHPREDGRFALGGFPGGGFPGMSEIVSQPTYFPMAGSKVGKMAEAGPEWAIAPLRRTSRGELGVSIAEGGGGRSVVVNAPMTFNGVPDQRTARMAADHMRRVVRQAISDEA